MKPAPFDYYAPTTILEAVDVLVGSGEEAKLLAGGQSLMPLLAMRLARPATLVDLNGVAALTGITLDETSLRVGAMTRQSDIEFDAVVASEVPLLAEATPLIGHFQIRNRGTIGGSIAHADPASEYPLVASVLDAELEIVGPGGTRTVGAAGFFRSFWTTALAPDEILVAVRFPRTRPHTGVAIREFSRRHGDFAIVGAAVSVTVDEACSVERIAVGLSGVDSVPHRLAAASELVGASATDIDIVDFARSAVGDLAPLDDLHASGRYRTAMAAVMIEDALRAALRSAGSNLLAVGV